MKRTGWLVLAGSLATGLLNYGYTVTLIFLLRPADFAKVASISSLLLLVGTAASATIPWVLAREICNSAHSADRRRHAVGFALTTSALAGIAAAAVLWLVEAAYADTSLILLSAVSCLSIFVTAAGAGYLQGRQRLAELTMYRLAEVAAKIVIGLGGAALAGSATAGVAGMATGSTLCACWALWIMRSDIGRRGRGQAGDRTLWRDAIGIGAVQCLCSLVQAADVIVLSLSVGATPAAAGYQGLMVLGRIPLFVSTALSVIAFPRLAADDITEYEARRVTRETLALYLVLSGLVVVALAALPRSILAMILPAHYAKFHALLLPLALAGALAGLLSLATTFLQAAGRYRAAIIVLAISAVAAAAALTAASGDLRVFAWTSASTTAATALVTMILVAPRRPASSVGTGHAVEGQVTAGSRDTRVLRPAAAATKAAPANRSSPASVTTSNPAPWPHGSPVAGQHSSATPATGAVSGRCRPANWSASR
ncbi:lipopolysaccharide biosynthesis protein [Actinoplanes aureus]|uniref:Lipopolysaccharide biosynthesis protein n=1 Tax=Actinoplanes aureus TaxID=2792083 RepID=A0A931G4W4_9ACTN|nr:lipopolysaccharide biosynthesis protein [Actinoplanes aureus]MBG0565679.1 lipopolysaccharide biosynthesis protein [Actinoplanes aureus]